MFWYVVETPRNGPRRAETRRDVPRRPETPQNATSNPCQDMFGSVATALVGIFVRIDAILTSIEAQQSTGSLHAHSQLFIQCLHQHNSLDDIIAILQNNYSGIVEMI